jgi:hypothetical protein
VNKLPYSVVLPYYNIALPLTDTQFNNFNVDMVHISSCIKDIDNYRMRGTLLRDGDNNGFTEMFNEYISIDISGFNQNDN